VIADGKIDLGKLRTQIRPETVLVSLERICGETGTIWDTRGVAHILEKARKPDEEKIILHIDASHSPRVESIERMRLGGDLITLDAQKVGGVRGVGVLFAPQHISLSPITHGGGQEHAMRPGTENVAAIVAFAEALTEAKEMRRVFVESAVRLRAALLSAIQKVSNAYENHGKECAPHILNISFVGRDTDYLVALLDKSGFAVSTKSACETDSEEGARSVSVLTNDNARAKSTLRISFALDTTTRDISRFSRALSTHIAFLDANKL
jgi:cysteine desulfurase